MREQAELEPEQIAKELGVKRDTYIRWETRGLIPYHLIIPFCLITEGDPYLLLSGQPYSIGKRRLEPAQPKPRSHLRPESPSRSQIPKR